MMSVERGEAPQLLVQCAQEVTANYVAKRKKKPNYRFQWRLPVYNAVHSGLTEMCKGHCSYCDGFPMQATGKDQVDHFKPKSRPEFWELVATWENLFLICTACNLAKREQWDENLLRPDAPDYDFFRYFSYRTDTGELEPSVIASAVDQLKAEKTIEILDLNRPDACIARRKELRLMTSADVDDLDDYGYRFLQVLL